MTEQLFGTPAAKDSGGGTGRTRSRPGRTGSFLTWRAWTKLVVCVGLGIALGAVNLAAVGAPGMLRIPAFLAALILCAQGTVDIGEYNREKEGIMAAEQAAHEEWEERKRVPRQAARR